MKRIVILVSCLLIYLNQEATNLWTYKANNKDPWRIWKKLSGPPYSEPAWDTNLEQYRQSEKGGLDDHDDKH